LEDISNNELSYSKVFCVTNEKEIEIMENIEEKKLF